MEENGDCLSVPIASRGDGGRTSSPMDAQDATAYLRVCPPRGGSSGSLHAGITWTQPILGNSSYKMAQEQAQINIEMARNHIEDAEAAILRSAAPARHTGHAPKKKKAPDGRWLPGAVRSVTAHAPARLHSYRALPGSSSPAVPGRPGVGLLHRIHESPGRLVPPEQLFHLFQVSDPELHRAAPHRAAMPADEQLRP